MRTNIEIDDALLAQAREYVPRLTKRALVEEAIRYFIARKAQEALATVHGTMDEADAPHRRRFRVSSLR